MELYIAGIFGLFIGSFLLVLASRLPRGEDVMMSRSHCESCNHTLMWYELIPLVSYVIQLGKCRNCNTHISIVYPLIEMVTGILAVILTSLFFPEPLLLLGWSIVVGALMVITIADFQTQIIPDSMQVLFLLGSLIVVFVSNSFSVPFSSIYAALGSMGFLLCIFLITRGRGMGFGDVKFALSMGLLLGFPRILFAHYIAFLTGAALGLILIMTRRKSLKSAIPFGPFLILGTVTTLIWGSGFIQYWNNLW